MSERESSNTRLRSRNFQRWDLDYSQIGREVSAAAVCVPAGLVSITRSHYDQVPVARLSAFPNFTQLIVEATDRSDP